MTNTYKSETLQIFEGKEEQFPMISQHIQRRTPMKRAIRQAESNSDPILEVIWAGPKDEQNAEVICQMSHADSSMVNSYVAKVLNNEGVEIDRAAFVGFECNTAFAKLTVPKSIFKECSVYMELASITVAPLRISSNVIMLEQFDIENLSIGYQIDAPAINRPNAENPIMISYYAGSSKTQYDYIYDGRRPDQMYFPSKGTITVQNIRLKSASATLEINGGKGYIMYPCSPKVNASDSDISYEFCDKWSGTKLSDCFNLHSANANILYKLAISAMNQSGDTITIVITNDEIITRGETAGTIIKIGPIKCYLDCLAKGTQISMADGSTKLIENICKGDLVKTKDGGSASVREVIMQEECQVVDLILRSGRKLVLTDGHAVYTKDGVYPVSRLKRGQEVVTEDGTDMIDEIVPYCERTYDVYTLHLDGGEWLFANGVVVYGSDNPDLFSDRDWVREGLPEEWLTDYDNALKAGILYGKQ